MRGTFKALVGKLQRKRPLGRRRRKVEDNIYTDLREQVVKVWAEFK
jgi:hypothetical protein